MKSQNFLGPQFRDKLEEQAKDLKQRVDAENKRIAEQKQYLTQLQSEKEKGFQIGNAPTPAGLPAEEKKILGMKPLVAAIVGTVLLAGIGTGIYFAVK